MKRNLVSSMFAVAVFAIGWSVTPCAAVELSNSAYRLVVDCANDRVNVTLDDLRMGFRLAEGPYYYRAERQNGDSTTISQGLEGASVEVSGNRLIIRGKLAGVDVEHVFELPPDRPIMEEHFIVHNTVDSLVALTDFEVGFVRPITDSVGKILPDLSNDRFVAVPFRAKPDDSTPDYNDFSIADLANKKCYEIRMKFDQKHERVPADHGQSEGWAWMHGSNTLGIFKFDQENMQWSILGVDKADEAMRLRFGGVRMIDGEPSDLGRMQPGQTVRLGLTRYETTPGGYENAMYAFRSLLDEKGCRFPKGFNPPVHWEQLYDMWDAWNDRLHNFTKAILEKEAEKGVAYSCEALYLDPGWDTGFATFLWGEQWLGPRKAFIEDMKSKYGLAVSLHTPLAPWMSGVPMGPGIGPATYPPEARRKSPLIFNPNLTKAPSIDCGRRNLSLLPEAKANASSVFQDGFYPIHQIVHLNDGWCGNDASWVAKAQDGWAEIDLGGEYEISKVRLSCDARKQFNDRLPVHYRILVATKYDPESKAAVWNAVAEVSGEPMHGTREFSFVPSKARWVRIQIIETQTDEPRLDEIEIYEDKLLAEKDISAWEAHARCRPLTIGSSTICIGSKAYLDEAVNRLISNCADGVAFLMFDGNSYQGGCEDPTHGHPVPFTKEDHMRANVEIARRVHEKYPNVLIEMHDMLMGGYWVRNTPVYYKYGLPGSYDENWGFELMWDPMADIVSGRARSLYYYNLGCNVPLYLHIDLHRDRIGCPMLWWYASTCRHLGIGGTHGYSAVAEAQKTAMRRYRELERFFKRGEFYGLGEEIHLHALPEENAFVVNLFNLSDETKSVGGSIDLGRMALKGQRLETDTENIGSLDNGVWTITRELAPWSAEVFHVRIAQ